MASPNYIEMLHQQEAPFRPVQYLGNKTRALPEILDALHDLIGGEGKVADLFTGTTVVAQGLALNGYQVDAVDAQKYASVFAQALLGIGKTLGESCASEVFSNLGILRQDENFFGEWLEYVDQEDRALKSGDAEALVALYARLPLIWRDKTHPSRKKIEAPEQPSAFDGSLLITSIYSGFYFGVRQALAIDWLRQNIEKYKQEMRLSQWQYNAALTSVMTAASAAVHSAGKHFAQPLNVGSLKNKKFLRSRLLQDRRIDIIAEFQSACNAINRKAPETDNGHFAWNIPAEEYAAHGNSADVFYMDPPYTAQQYSRFYHLLETLCSYEYPQILVNGRSTSGLYPARRYKSAFCSKRGAPGAFRSLISTARGIKAAVLISYSESAVGSNGNARMISLGELLDICRAEYGDAGVNFYRLRHRYRQFNNAAVSKIARDDSEVLIACKRR